MVHVSHLLEIRIQVSLGLTDLSERLQKMFSETCVEFNCADEFN
jgi:hypothetical protein